ncbi:MAG: ferrochelatase [Gammaproteobacteria bacterium RIFCSPHIGHO2_12_FULL_38_14]|nr:MAG: ferrochelatase [Gammaproteobacteria bacterium RIFCSPHIGHO2_12_FULL_38_14]
MSKIGILLTNTGTPSAVTTKAVRQYLKEFLSDKRVVSLPMPLWLPILYGFILPFRPTKSAKLYKKIWQANGSPMRVIMQNLSQALEKQLQHILQIECHVAIGMNYGEPSIDTGFTQLYSKNVEKIITLPLFPQYSHVTTASTEDRLLASIKKYNIKVDFNFIKHYQDHPVYIDALAASVKQQWEATGQAHLLISFHGIPKKMAAKGDPYIQECEATANRLAGALKLSKNEWTLCYQSRFGYKKWLEPATHQVLKQLVQKNIRQVNIICPGFAVDCLETLEEIAIRAKHIFLAEGGESLQYIPALNDSRAQVDLLAAIVASHTC